MAPAVVRIENDVERGIFASLRCMCGDARATCCRRARATPSRRRGGRDRDPRQAARRARRATRSSPSTRREYGAEALAVPPEHGLFRAIWLVPVVGIGLGAFGLARMVRRWRRATAGGGPAGQGAATRDAYDARLDDELKDLDG